MQKTRAGLKLIRIALNWTFRCLAWSIGLGSLVFTIAQLSDIYGLIHLSDIFLSLLLVINVFVALLAVIMTLTGAGFCGTAPVYTDARGEISTAIGAVLMASSGGLLFAFLAWLDFSAPAYVVIGLSLLVVISYCVAAIYFLLFLKGLAEFIGSAQIIETAERVLKVFYIGLQLAVITSLVGSVGFSMPLLILLSVFCFALEIVFFHQLYALLNKLISEIDELELPAEN